MTDSATDTNDPVADSTHPLDSEESRARHHKLMEWLYEARQAQSANRMEMAIDEDFYDGDQYTIEERDELRQRGQPIIKYNLIKQYIDWIIGTERRARVDFQVFPRGREDREAAETKTKLLKYNSDVNRVPFVRSRAFKEAVVAGLGWVEDVVRNDETEEVTYSRQESWRNIWYDHLAAEPDLSDARFLFRMRVVDLDVALAMFPDRQDEIRRAAKNAAQFDFYDELFYSDYHQARDEYDRPIYQGPTFSADAGSVNDRRARVKLYEVEYREIQNVKIMRGEEPFNGLDYNESVPAMQQAVAGELVSLFDALVMRMRYAVMTDEALLHDGPSPFRHNKFRFTPIWCYRRARDRMPYGMVRNGRDPQKAANKRMGKALHILSTSRIVADEDAMDSPEKWDEVIEEAARPDGVIRVSKPNARFELQSDRNLADGHLKMLTYDIEFLRSGTGVTGENVGQDTNAQSGKAIMAKQNEGSMTTAEVFDNLRFAVQVQGEKQLSNIEQYMGAPRVIRVLGDRGIPEYLSLNQVQPDGTILNDITADKADFVVDQRDYRESVRQAMFESMMDLIGRLPPDVSLQMLDLVVDMSDIPNHESLVARIRKINGQTDPDAELTPEQQQAQAQQAAQAQQQAETNQRAIDAKTAHNEALARNLDAKSAAHRMDVIRAGIEASHMVNPATAPAADELIRSAQGQS